MIFELEICGLFMQYTVFRGVRVTRSLVLRGCFVDGCLCFCPFFAIVFSVLLRFTDPNYLFGILKHFFIE